MGAFYTPSSAYFTITCTQACGHEVSTSVTKPSERATRSRLESRSCEPCRIAGNKAAAAEVLAGLETLVLPELQPDPDYDGHGARARASAIAAVTTMCKSGTESEFFPANVVECFRELVATTNQRTLVCWWRSAGDAGYRYCTFAWMKIRDREEGRDKMWDKLDALLKANGEKARAK